MKLHAVVVYDSAYGNTEKVAFALRDSLKTDVKLYKPQDIDTGDLKSANLLIVGSPTQGGRATAQLHSFLENIPAGSLKNTKVAAFDTRFLEKDQRIPVRLLMKVIGYAAPKIAQLLEKKGGTLVVPPEGFIVEGKEGPLRSGELQRVPDWVNSILKEVGT